MNAVSMACTATELFQGLTQLSVETHLNTDKAKLTLFKQQTKKPTPKKSEKGGGGRAGDSEGINCHLEHHRDFAVFILDCFYRSGKKLLEG